MAKKLPKPFQRPGIEISGGGGPAKKWLDIKASDLQIGDILPGHGEVTKIKVYEGADLKHRVEFFSGECLFIPPTEVVVAFTSFKK